MLLRLALRSLCLQGEVAPVPGGIEEDGFRRFASADVSQILAVLCVSQAVDGGSHMRLPSRRM